MILEKNNLQTVALDHRRLGLKRLAGKQILSKQNNPVPHLFTNLFYKVNWTAPKFNFML